jgi:hypothetical protein
MTEFDARLETVDGCFVIYILRGNIINMEESTPLIT